MQRIAEYQHCKLLKDAIQSHDLSTIQQAIDTVSRFYRNRVQQYNQHEQRLPPEVVTGWLFPPSVHALKTEAVSYMQALQNQVQEMDRHDEKVALNRIANMISQAVKKNPKLLEQAAGAIFNPSKRWPPESKARLGLLKKLSQVYTHTHTQGWCWVTHECESEVPQHMLATAGIDPVRLWSAIQGASHKTESPSPPVSEPSGTRKHRFEVKEAPQLLVPLPQLLCLWLVRFESKFSGPRMQQ